MRWWIRWKYFRCDAREEARITSGVDSFGDEDCVGVFEPEFEKIPDKRRRAVPDCSRLPRESLPRPRLATRRNVPSSSFFWAMRTVWNFSTISLGVAFSFEALGRFFTIHEDFRRSSAWLRRRGSFWKHIWRNSRQLDEMPSGRGGESSWLMWNMAVIAGIS